MSEDTTAGATPEIQAPVTPLSLNDFEDTFFNRAPAPQEDPPAEVKTETTPLVEETTAENPDLVETEEAPAEPKKKKSAQERINELTAKARTAEREAEALRQRIQLLETSPKVVEPTPETTKTVETLAPSPDALDKDGNPKYEFGQFDPEFLKDWTEYTFKEQEILAEKRRLKMAEDAIRQAEAEKLEAEKAELQMNWSSKAEEFSSENPDFQQKSAELVNSLSYLEPELGEQVALAMLTLDNGPQVMYYLANHPDEAHGLVKGGLAKVLMGLGAIDSKFSKTETVTAAPKASKAPTPPPINRGSNGQFSSDPNSLEAFEKKFYSK